VKKYTIIKTLLGYFALLSTSYGAAEIPETGSADVVFLLIASALVFLMQAGFCLLEMGFSRAKNAINIVMKNVCDMSVGMIGFFFVGFGLMFGWSQGGFIGLGNFGFSSDFAANSEVWMFFLFQAMFAATTVTISSGAMAERTYHGVGGAFALAGIMVIGPRKGRFLEDGSERIFSGHNIPLGALGMFLLFFGWFGFNCGSNLTADATIGFIAANTALSGCAGLIFGMNHCMC